MIAYRLTTRAWGGAGLVTLAVLAAVAYGNTFGAPFVWDDIVEIERNDALDTLWPPGVPMFRGGRLPHRPLPYYSFAINAAINRLAGVESRDVRSFHALNLAIHVVNACVVWWLVTRVVRRLDTNRRLHPASVGWAAAAIWLSHPLNTQAVTYVYQRIESLAAGCMLATLACFVAAIEARRPLPWLVASVACCGFAMASKETAVVTPLLVFAYALLASDPEPARRREIVRGHARYFACLAATWIVLAAVLFVQRGRYPELNGLDSARWRYAMNQPLVVLQYLRLAVWPHPLVFDPDWRQPHGWLELMPGIVVVGAMLVALVAMWKTRPSVACVILAFVLTLAPSSSFIPASANRPYAEYRMYLPLVFLVAGGVATAAVALRNTRRLIAAAATIAVVFASLAHARNEAYSSGETLWADTFAKQPWNRRALHNLVALLLQSGRDDVVLDLYERLGHRLDDHLESVARKSNLLQLAGRHAEATAAADAARELARATLRRDPGNAEAWYHLGNLLREQEPRAAIEAFGRAARLDPRQADARCNLGALIARESPAEAERLYREALTIDPAHADAHANLGVILARRGDVTGACGHLETALRWEPGHETARDNLARLRSAPE